MTKIRTITFDVSAIIHADICQRHLKRKLYVCMFCNWKNILQYDLNIKTGYKDQLLWYISQLATIELRYL